MKNQVRQVLCLFVALLATAVWALDVGEAVTLTVDTSNDPAPIESRQEEILRSVSSDQPSPTQSLGPKGTKGLSLQEGCEFSACVPPPAAAVKAARALLRFLVVQRK